MSVAAASTEIELVVFTLDEQRYALELTRVERALPMVALAPFPKGPAIVEGVFNFRGTLVPVISLRRRFRLPERAARVGDQLLMVRTPRRGLALAVDRVENIVRVPTAEVTPPAELVPGLEFVRGVARLREGIVFVHDLDTLLSLDEEAKIDEALERAAL